MKYNQTQLQEVLKNSSYTDIGALPSQCHGYDWNSLYIRPLGVKEYKLISKAAVLGELNHMTRAIDLCITQSADDLTIGDYYYIMLWLRVHSMTKTPLIMDWECDAKVLQHKETGAIIYNDENFQTPEKLEEYAWVDCGRHNTETVHMSNINIMSLDEEREKVVIPEGFDFPRARHIDGIRASLKDPELQLLMPAVQWIKGDTVVDKLKVLFADDNEKGVEMLDMGNTLEATYQHGFNEVLTLCCNRCRIKAEHIINPSPLTFFP